MNSKDDEVVSNIFDIPNSTDTQAFAPYSDLLQSSLSLKTTDQNDNYLRVIIGEPLRYALAYVIIYRPEDAIEFIANFLIDWSRKKTRQEMIDQETNSILTSIEMYREQTLIDEEQRKEKKRLLIERKEKQQQQIIFQYDKHVITSYQWDFNIDPRTDDEREPSKKFQEEKQSHRQLFKTNTQQYIHTHDTASGFANEKENNQTNSKSRICNDGNLSSFTYFSKLKDRIIKCDET